MVHNRNIPFGQLNPIMNESNSPELDLNNFSFLKTLKQYTKERFFPDILKNRTEFIAQVYKKISPEDARNVGLETFSNYSGFKAPKLMIVAKPLDIMEHLPEPSGPDDNIFISLFPQFEVADLSNQPDIGDLVRVTWRNIDTLEGGIYLGPYSAKGDISGVGMSISQFGEARGAFAGNSPKIRERNLEVGTAPTQPSGRHADRGGIIFNGEEIPWTSKIPLDWWFLEKSLQRGKRTPPEIDKAVIHYTEGAVTSLTAKGAWATFNNGSVDSHFIIEANGRIVQIMDLSLTAYHAGDSDVNADSVGIDFVNPITISKRVFLDRDKPMAPWTYKTGFDVVGGIDVSSKHFYGPTPAQLESGRQLLMWLNSELGVPLKAPGASTNPNKIEYRPGPYEPGIYHHAEVYKGRADCIGIYIPTDLLM